MLTVSVYMSTDMSDDDYETPGVNDEMTDAQMESWLKIFEAEPKSESVGEH